MKIPVRKVFMQTYFLYLHYTYIDGILSDEGEFIEYIKNSYDIVPEKLKINLGIKLYIPTNETTS